MIRRTMRLGLAAAALPGCVTVEAPGPCMGTPVVRSCQPCEQGPMPTPVPMRLERQGVDPGPRPPSAGPNPGVELEAPVPTPAPIRTRTVRQAWRPAVTTVEGAYAPAGEE